MLPTVTTYSMFLTGGVDAREKCGMVLLDVDNTFLRANTDKTIQMVLCCRMVELVGPRQWLSILPVHSVLSIRDTNVVRLAIHGVL